MSASAGKHTPTQNITTFEHLSGHHIERSISAQEKAHADSNKARKRQKVFSKHLPLKATIVPASLMLCLRKASDSSAMSLCSESATPSQRNYKIAKNVAKQSIRNHSSYKMNKKSMKEKFSSHMGKEESSKPSSQMCILS